MNTLSKKTILKIAVSIFIGIAGLLTVIFAILNLAGNNSINASSVLKIITGIVFLVIGISMALFTLFTEVETAPINLVLSATCMGLGIFCFFPDSTKFIDTIVCFILPIIIACYGALILTKSIIDGIQKSDKKYILPAVIGAALLVIGVIIAVFHNNKTLQNVVWLILGFGIVALAVVEIVTLLSRKRPRAKVSK